MCAICKSPRPAPGPGAAASARPEKRWSVGGRESAGALRAVGGDGEPKPAASPGAESPLQRDEVLSCSGSERWTGPWAGGGGAKGGLRGRGRTGSGSRGGGASPKPCRPRQSPPCSKIQLRRSTWSGPCWRPLARPPTSWPLHSLSKSAVKMHRDACPNRPLPAHPTCSGNARYAVKLFRPRTIQNTNKTAKGSNR